MPDDGKFAITEYDQRRLIIDLLIRVTCENHAMKQVIAGMLSQGNISRLQLMLQDFQSRYGNENKKIREMIYANYGHVDLDDVLKPEE